MKYGSVCSGVEAATVAWHPLNWEPQWFSEIEKFPSAVLAHHYPNVPNLGDMTKFKEWPSEQSINLLVGGTPCQSFSVAGLRKGLDDPRGNLMLTYLAIASRYRPRWLAWENVPGVLSSNGGSDFGTFLWALGELGYGFAYRTLNAQYFGVAQRRRRVFVVGYLGDWRRAAAVLFERHSLSGHPAPRREKRQETPGFTSTSFGSYGEGVGTVRAAGGDLGGGSETLVAKCLTSRVGSAYDAQTEQFVTENKWPADVASTLNASFGDKQGLEDQHINGGAPLFVPAHETVGTLTASYGMGGVDIETKPVVFGAQNSANQGDSVSTDVTPTLDKSKTPAVAYDMKQHHNPQPTDTIALTTGNCNTVRGDTPLLKTSMKVRRLTPTECERLQGFPDNYTRIPYRNKDAENCPDGPRYKAMGNSMAVPVMRWIGERIQMVENLNEYKE